MAFLDRVQAAISAFSGKSPQGKAMENPFFYSYTGNGTGQASYNVKVNPQKLRAFSEQAVPRHAIDYIRNQVSKLDWDIVPLPGKKFTAEQKKKVQIAKNVFRRPNVDDNFMTFTGQLIEDMLVVGSGTFEIKDWTGNTENPFLFYPTDSTSIQIYLDWNGSPSQKRYAQNDLQGKQIDFTPKEMMMIPYTKRTSTPFGIGPVEAAYVQIQYLMDAQAYAGKTASTATPKKLLYMGAEVTDTQLKEFRLYWQNEVEGRSNVPIIGGTDAVQSVELGAATDDSLYLRWQSFLISVIANAFGLDSTKFGATLALGRSTGETLDSMSDEGAVRPVAHILEHYFTQLLTLFGLDDVAEFQFMFITSMDDKKAMGAIHQLYANMDAMTIDEIRSEIGLPPLGNDPETGEAMGALTISVYRAKYGTPPPAPVEDTNDPEAAKGQVNGDKTKTGNEAKNSGVNGQSKPKDKSLSKAHDAGLNA